MNQAYFRAVETALRDHPTVLKELESPRDSKNKLSFRESILSARAEAIENALASISEDSRLLLKKMYFEKARAETVQKEFGLTAPAFHKARRAALAAVAPAVLGPFAFDSNDQDKSKRRLIRPR